MADTDHGRLVMAAQQGDSQAQAELIATYLPLIYNVVGRALNGHADVDDVVQETLLRIVRDLPSLRDPASFRSWLVAITIRQIGSHRDRQRVIKERVRAIEEIGEPVDEAAQLENLAILQVQLSGQRRQIAEASLWLDEEDRVLLSLWWQENAGALSRTEIAEAMDVTIPHVGVRLQRMRDQLQLCRVMVAALAADPRCPGLAAAVAEWDGKRAPLWRKRIGRHVRECAACLAAAEEQVPVERLLTTFASLTIPAAVRSASEGAVSAAAGPAGVTSPHSTLPAKLSGMLTSRHWASFAIGAALVAGATTAYLALPEPQQKQPAIAVPSDRPASAAASPSASARVPVVPTPTPSAVPSRAASPAAPLTVPRGVWSLELAVAPGQYLTTAGLYAVVGHVAPSSSLQAKQEATFTVVDGLADSTCVTFRSVDGRYLRHYELRLRLSADDGSSLFREDATFCPRKGGAPGTVTLQAHNYPALVLHHRDGGVFIDVPDGSPTFAQESSFAARIPWAR